MNIDIIIYAVIAVILLSRLWKVFGQRNDEDVSRPNPFTAPPRPKDDGVPVLNSGAMRIGPAPVLPPPLKLAPASVAGGLEQIKTLDPAFDEKQFLQVARTAFTLIIDAFAKGDLERLTPLVGPSVLTHFRAAIESRLQAGEKMENKIIAIKEAETIAAKTDGKQALITVRFVSEQENTLRDAGGQVIGGDAGKSEEVTDSWVFGRDTESADAAWRLVETHG